MNLDEALTLAKVLAGLNAQSKGRRLGIYPERLEGEKPEKNRQRLLEETFSVEVLGRQVPAIHTKDGIRAIERDKPVSIRVTRESGSAVISSSAGSAHTRRRTPVQRRWPGAG